MKQWIIAGFLSVGAIAAACTTTNVNTGGSAGTGSASTSTSGGTSTSTSAGSAGSSTTHSTSSSSGTSSSGASSSSTSSSGGAGGAGTSSSSSGAPDYCSAPRSGEDCDACPDTGTCVTCCAVAVPTGYTDFYNYLAQACACDADAPCNAECSDPGDICPDLQNPPSIACSNCLGLLPGDTSCLATVSPECDNDPNCVLLQACYGGCPM